MVYLTRFISATWLTLNQLIISCRSGRRSQLAAEYVVEHLGFQNVYNVEGGILKWMEQGYPTEVAAF